MEEPQDNESKNGDNGSHPSLALAIANIQGRL